MLIKLKLNVNKIVSRFLQGQRKVLFLNKQNIPEFFYSTVRCELCVYGREGPNLR